MQQRAGAYLSNSPYCPHRSTQSCSQNTPQNTPQCHWQHPRFPLGTPHIAIGNTPQCHWQHPTLPLATPHIAIGNTAVPNTTTNNNTTAALQVLEVLSTARERIDRAEAQLDEAQRRGALLLTVDCCSARLVCVEERYLSMNCTHCLLMHCTHYLLVPGRLSILAGAAC